MDKTGEAAVGTEADIDDVTQNIAGFQQEAMETREVAIKLPPSASGVVRGSPLLRVEVGSFLSDARKVS